MRDRDEARMKAIRDKKQWDKMTVTNHNAVRDPTDCRLCGEEIEADSNVATIPTGRAFYRRGRMEAAVDTFALGMRSSGSGEIFHYECLYGELGLLPGDSDE